MVHICYTYDPSTEDTEAGTTSLMSVELTQTQETPGSIVPHN